MIGSISNYSAVTTCSACNANAGVYSGQGQSESTLCTAAKVSNSMGATSEVSCLLSLVSWYGQAELRSVSFSDCGAGPLPLLAIARMATPSVIHALQGPFPQS